MVVAGAFLAKLLRPAVSSQPALDQPVSRFGSNLDSFGLHGGAGRAGRSDRNQVLGSSPSERLVDLVVVGFLDWIAGMVWPGLAVQRNIPSARTAVWLDSDANRWAPGRRSLLVNADGVTQVLCVSLPGKVICYGKFGAVDSGRHQFTSSSISKLCVCVFRIRDSIAGSIWLGSTNYSCRPGLAPHVHCLDRRHIFWSLRFPRSTECGDVLAGPDNLCCRIGVFEFLACCSFCSFRDGGASSES